MSAIWLHVCTRTHAQIWVQTDACKSQWSIKKWLHILYSNCQSWEDYEWWAEGAKTIRTHRNTRYYWANKLLLGHVYNSTFIGICEIHRRYIEETLFLIGNFNWLNKCSILTQRWAKRWVLSGLYTPSHRSCNCLIKVNCVTKQHDNVVL